MNSIRNLLINTFLVCILLWGIVSIARTLYNFTKLYSEEKRFYFTSEKQKSEMTYGDVYDFCSFAVDNTPDKSVIIFLASGGRPFYLCRYLAYPRKLFLARNPNEAKVMVKLGLCNFLLEYRSSDPNDNNYKSENWQTIGLSPISHYVSNKKTEGFLYKL